jgi:hypothetical protein
VASSEGWVALIAGGLVSVKLWSVIVGNVEIA